MAFPGDQHDSPGWGSPPPPRSPLDHGYDGGPPPLYDEGPPVEQGSPSPLERPPRPGGRRWLILAVAAVVVVLGGGTGLILTSGGGSDAPSPSPTPTPAATTTNPTPEPTETGRGERLHSRATDPEPLTLNEIFRHHRFKGGGRRYTMTARRSDHTCARGVQGSTFRRLLKRGGCTQVLRATFTNGKLIGTIGVLNLRTQTGARAAQRASRPKDTFVMPLPGSGLTRRIGQGLSLTTAEANGHYLILSWVQLPSGKKIAQSDYSSVTAFVQYTTLGSNLRPALNYRSMVGKPA